ncbi:MAG: 3-dehydroquinate synthase [Filifactoraceae bacterium]
MQISINLQNNNYKILVEKGSIEQLPQYITPQSKIMVITDTNMPESIIKQVIGLVPKSIFHKCPSGEISKSMEEFQNIHSLLLENNFERTDYIITLGGGVIGDLGGFVASTYLRGIKYINIPTTTLSQIDSSIGGKVAINFKGVKNIIGAFHHPEVVIIDTNLISTLPKRQFNNGIIEAIKAGLIGDKQLFELICQSAEENTLDDNIERIIISSLLVKKNYIERDEKERSLRKTLNFGHTIAHALESYYSLETLLHGEAVGIGMLKMSNGKPYYNKLLTLLKTLNIPTHLEYNIDEIMNLVQKDKKLSNELLTEAFVDEIGEVYLERITLEDFKKYL